MRVCYDRRPVRRRRNPRGVRILVAGALDPVPVRVGAPPPCPTPSRVRRTGWLALSALLHAAALAAAVAWIDRHDVVSTEQAPIAWVRVEPDEREPDASPPAARSRAEARPEAPPTPRPAPKPRAARARTEPARDAPPPAPASANREPASALPAEATGASETHASTPVADASDAAISASAVQAAAGAGVAGSTGTSNAGGGATGKSDGGGGSGTSSGWMPRGGEQPPPAYPEGARRRGVEGVSQVALRLAASGRVEEVRLHRSAGDERLDDAALAAVRRWHFEAPPSDARWNGIWFVVPIEFRLR